MLTGISGTAVGQNPLISLAFGNRGFAPIFLLAYRCRMITFLKRYYGVEMSDMKNRHFGPKPKMKGDL